MPGYTDVDEGRKQNLLLQYNYLYFAAFRVNQKATWNNSIRIKENVVEEVTKLKQQPGQDILITGSATLVQSLMQTDLIDEYKFP